MGDVAPPLGNDEIAARFEEAAALLEAQDANPFRVGAYRRAAARLRALPRPASEILRCRGRAGLEQLPDVGASLARAIEELAQSGEWSFLERLRGLRDPVRTLATVPGMGRELAERVHRTLGIESLAELEAAALDGRLEQVPGFGKRRVRGVRESLAGRFARRGPAVRLAPAPGDDAPGEPSTEELLDVDAEYRRRSAAGDLPKIAPTRFNPGHVAWLPILHTERGGRHYTALYSNTARAHELGATHDWVVIYRDDHGGAGQWTVVTARRGPNAGKRIVAGREEPARAGGTG